MAETQHIRVRDREYERLHSLKSPGDTFPDAIETALDQREDLLDRVEELEAQLDNQKATEESRP